MDRLNINKSRAGKFWFLLLLLGIFALILGFYFLSTYGAGFEFIAFIVAIYFLVSGIVRLITAILSRGIYGWQFNLVLSIISFIVGILMIVDYFSHWMASVSEILVLTFCGIGLIAESVTLIASGISMRNEEGNSWILTLILGISQLVLSSIIIANPLYSIMLINLFVSMAVLVFGVTCIVLALQLRRIKKALF